MADRYVMGRIEVRQGAGWIVFSLRVSSGGESSSDSQHQMPDRLRSRFHLDFDVVAEPIQAVHKLALG